MSEAAAELVLVLMIVGAVVVLGVRSLFRLIGDRKTGSCCGCPSCTRGNNDELKG